MYQVGDKVVYSVHGVCMVVEQEERVVDRKRLKYLVLEPVRQDGSRYLVPTHNAVAMAKLRRMVSKEELEAIWQSDAAREDCWIPDENQRKQAYRELIGSCDRISLIRMVRTLYRHKARQSLAGKKVHLCDDNFLRDAEKLLLSEVSEVMGMEPEQAKQYLRSKVKEDA